MKLSFNMQKKEISLNADVETLIDKRLDKRDERPPKKTRYQIRQEEKRKNQELKAKQALIFFAILMGMTLFFFTIALIGASLS